jgi:hypothetical protein
VVVAPFEKLVDEILDGAALLGADRHVLGLARDAVGHGSDRNKFV